MQIDSSYVQPTVLAPIKTPLVPLTDTKPEDAPVSRAASPSRAASLAGRFSVLNDFRYLTDSDKDMLAAVTGEKIEPGFTDKPGAASAFALQLALDRRTGELAPNQAVTSTYLRNAAAEMDARNAGRPNARNPYSGEVMDKAVAWLDAHGLNRADLRL